MHLGNARTALLAWLDARARGGRVVLRIEDLDRDRCRPQHAEGLRSDLAWLGLDWDEETAPQSARDDAYAEALACLDARDLLYECFCTRRELHEASAPHGPGDEPPRYPGTCRGLGDGERAARRKGGRRPALRLAMPDVEVELTDRIHGPLAERVAEVTGDIVVRRSDGLAAYQLAVVVDDAADGVTDVVRGDDLLTSAPRQAALAGLLGLDVPAYAHVPLLLGPDGARLAKRHGAVAVAELRERGIEADVLVGRLAASAGIGDGSPAAPDALVAGFGIDRVDREPVVGFAVPTV